MEKQLFLATFRLQGMAKLPKEIENQYHVNHWLYIHILTGAVIGVLISYSLKCESFSEIFRNVSFSCMASGITGWIIDKVNTDDKNYKANAVYTITYTKLFAALRAYCMSWARACSLLIQDYKDGNSKKHLYQDEKHTWYEWFEIIRSYFDACDFNGRKRITIYVEEYVSDYL